MATPTNLPATAVSGEILTAAYVNNLRGAFRVLQVVYATTNTPLLSSTTAFATTGLTATITPQSTSNKVLAIVTQNGCYKGPGNANNGLNLRLMRAGTKIADIMVAGGYTNTTLTQFIGTGSVAILDSPSTIAATIYNTEFANQQASADVGVQTVNATSTIILMEISA